MNNTTTNQCGIMPKVTIEPFEDGYLVTFHTAGTPCAWFPTYAEAVAAIY